MPKLDRTRRLRNFDAFDLVCHVAFDPAFAADVPYVVGVVDLSEGARLIGRVEGIPHDELKAGAPLTPVIHHREDGQPALTFVPPTTGSSG